MTSSKWGILMPDDTAQIIAAITENRNHLGTEIGKVHGKIEKVDERLGGKIESLQKDVAKLDKGLALVKKDVNGVEQPCPELTTHLGEHRKVTSEFVKAAIRYIVAGAVALILAGLAAKGLGG